MAWALFRQFDFGGGENLSLQSNMLADNQVQIALNKVITSEGLLETRKGKTKVNSNTPAAGGITSIHRFTKESGTQYLVVQHDTSLYAPTWDGSATLTTLGTAIATGLNAAKFRSKVWKDQIILTNGSDNVKTFNGTTFTDLGGSPPKSKWITIYANKLWLGDVSNPNFLRFSGVEDPASWDALDVIKVRTADGDTITGTASVPGGLVIFKKNSVFPLYGNTRDNIRVGEPISNYIGCCGFDAYTEDGLFVGRDNLYRFDLSSVTPLSQTHNRIFTDAGIGVLDDAIVQSFPREMMVVCHIPNASKDAIIVDARKGGITRWRGLNIGSMCITDDKVDPADLIIGDATTAQIYKYYGDNDDGTKINWEIRSKHFNNDTQREKVWRFIQTEVEYLEGTSYAAYVTADTDFETITESLTIDGDLETSTGLIWGTGLWGAEKWGSSRVKIRDRFFFNLLRGTFASFKFIGTQRIRFQGLTSRYREVGNL